MQWKIPATTIIPLFRIPSLRPPHNLNSETCWTYQVIGLVFPYLVLPLWIPSVMTTIIKAFRGFFSKNKNKKGPHCISVLLVAGLKLCVARKLLPLKIRKQNGFVVYVWESRKLHFQMAFWIAKLPCFFSRQTPVSTTSCKWE